MFHRIAQQAGFHIFQSDTLMCFLLRGQIFRDIAIIRNRNLYALPNSFCFEKRFSGAITPTERAVLDRISTIG